MPATLHDFSRTEPKEIPISLPIYKVKCQQCEFREEGIRNENAARSKAIIHCRVHRHVVHITYDIKDCPLETIRPGEVR